MSQSYYTEEFKRDAISQVTDRGYSIKEVAERLGISTKSLYYWRKVYGAPKPEHKKDAVQSSEIRRLKAELAGVTEERDILKRPRCISQKKPSEICLYQG